MFAVQFSTSTNRDGGESRSNLSQPKTLYSRYERHEVMGLDFEWAFSLFSPDAHPQFDLVSMEHDDSFYVEQELALYERFSRTPFNYKPVHRALIDFGINYKLIEMKRA